jgi:hypothetical protein
MWVELDLQDHVALKDCISYSGLKYLARSVQHYVNRDDREVTYAQRAVMDFGSAIDVAIFTPQDFDRLVVSCPEEFLAKNGAMSTKAAKDWRANQDKKAIILKAPDIERVKAMVSVIRSRRAAMKVLSKGFAQKSGVFKLPAVCGDNVWAKIRPDWISQAFERPTVVDYKSTEDASFEKFQQLIYNMKYHWQAALYCMGASAINGVTHKDFIWIVQERKPPFEVAVYRADEDMLNVARKEMLPLLKRWGRLQDGTESWSQGYPDAIQPMALPYWAEKKVEALLERQELVESLVEGGE